MQAWLSVASLDDGEASTISTADDPSLVELSNASRSAVVAASFGAVPSLSTDRPPSAPGSSSLDESAKCRVGSEAWSSKDAEQAVCARASMTGISTWEEAESESIRSVRAKAGPLTLL
jgi:hypothetical protein